LPATSCAGAPSGIPSSPLALSHLDRVGQVGQVSPADSLALRSAVQAVMRPANAVPMAAIALSTSAVGAGPPPEPSDSATEGASCLYAAASRAWSARSRSWMAPARSCSAISSRSRTPWSVVASLVSSSRFLRSSSSASLWKMCACSSVVSPGVLGAGAVAAGSASPPPPRSTPTPRRVNAIRPTAATGQAEPKTPPQSARCILRHTPPHMHRMRRGGAVIHTPPRSRAANLHMWTLADGPPAVAPSSDSSSVRQVPEVTTGRHHPADYDRGCICAGVSASGK
jgi:hypothetical protein